MILCVVGIGAIYTAFISVASYTTLRKVQQSGIVEAQKSVFQGRGLLVSLLLTSDSLFSGRTF